MLTLSSSQKSFIQSSFVHNCRPDGRQTCERRPICISYGPNLLCNSNSSCKLTLPDTKSVLICSAKAEIAKPEKNKPNQGI